MLELFAAVSRNACHGALGVGLMREMERRGTCCVYTGQTKPEEHLISSTQAKRRRGRRCFNTEETGGVGGGGLSSLLRNSAGISPHVEPSVDRLVFFI